MPAVKNQSWVGCPLDAFVLAKLEARGLVPNPPASRRELIRRVYYDLTGLPPAPLDVEAFEADPSPDAYGRLVDRLLDSPRYGEKWGRHWLDLVRFAETNSYERDNPKPNAWRYRDYVIRSFNADKPYDQFIREQLAGDELPSISEQGVGDEGIPSQNGDALIATGYYRLGIWDDEPTDREQARYDALDDIVATTGQVFLGLTFDCARCHDHKIDPIPQKDYYRLLSFFHNINHYTNGGPTDERPIFTRVDEQQTYEQRVRELEQKRQRVQAEITAIEHDFRQLIEGTGKPAPDDIAKWIKADGRQVLGDERFKQYQELKHQQASLSKDKVPAEMALCVTEPGRFAPETFVLARGNPHVQADRVEPAFPIVLGGTTPAIPDPPDGAVTCGRRLALANWIASKENLLTARVMVNRVWQYHFGRGIVRSPNNFGTQGDKPTHPELLDWLASEFMNPSPLPSPSKEVGANPDRSSLGGEDKGARLVRPWSLKHLHRVILLSNAYRMSSRGDDAALATDPSNDLFWRFDMRRLSAEEIRDSILAVSGTLNAKMFGPGVYVEIPKDVLAGQSVPGKGWGKSPPGDENRRSIYIHVKRSLLTPILECFDVADTDRSASVRFATTQPTQALTMLNGDFLNQQAAKFAERLRHEAGEDVSKQVHLALYLATARQPNNAEIRRGVGLIESLRTKEGATPEQAMKYFCLMVLNLNDFVYLD